MVTIFLISAFLRGFCILITAILKNCMKTYCQVKKTKNPPDLYLYISINVNQAQDEVLSANMVGEKINPCLK